MSYRDFEPVELPQAAHPDRFSQSFLRLFDRCKRAGFLYLRDDGGTGSHEMHRGSAAHEAVARLIVACLEAEEPVVPGELGKAVLDEVLADHPEWTIPLREQDRLRAIVWRWAQHTVLELDKIAAVEQKFVMDAGGRELSGIVDFAAIDGNAVFVRDWKTQLHYPAQEEFEAQFQLPFYAALLAFGHPEVDGVRQPRLGVGLEHFWLSEVYPAVELKEGGLASRERYMSILEVQEVRADLERLAVQADAALDSGQWPAVAGSHCSTCPAPADCPIPARLRRHAGAINDMEQAAEAAEWAERVKDDVAATEKELRRFASAHGPIFYGADRARVLETETSYSVDREGMQQAALEAAQYGTPFDPADWVRERRSTRFKAKTVGPEERAEAA